MMKLLAIDLNSAVKLGELMLYAKPLNAKSKSQNMQMIENQWGLPLSTD